MNKKLLSNTLFYSLISFLPTAVGFFTLPILTRYLTSADYGLVSLVNVFISSVSIVSSMQIHAGVSRLYFDFDEGGKNTYFSTLFWALVIVSIVLLCLMIFFGSEITGFLFRADIPFYPSFSVAMITVVSGLMIGLTNAFFRVEERGRELLFISFAGFLIGITVTLVLVIVFQYGPLGMLIGTAVSSSFCFVLQLYSLKSRLRLVFDSAIFVENIKFGIPVIPHALGGFLFMYSDKLILDKYVTLSIIGIYAIADRFSKLMKVVVNAYSKAFMPIFILRCKDSIEKGQQLCLETSGPWLVFMALAYVFLCHVGQYILYSLTTEAFYPAADLVPVLALAYVFRGIYIFKINTFYFLKKTKYLPVVTLSSGILNVGLNMWAIPKWGVMGAAITTALCFFVNWLLFEVLTRKTFSINLDRSALVFLLSVCSFSLVLFYYLDNLSSLKERMLVQSIFLLSVLIVTAVSNVGNFRESTLIRIKALYREKTYDS